MNCPYCDGPLIFKYSCPCSPQHILCRNCSAIGCFECNRPLQPIPQKIICIECFNFHYSHRIFQTEKTGRGYCVECCYHFYTLAKSKKIDQKQIKIGLRSAKNVSLSQIQQFLAKFCIKCKKYLNKKKNNEEEQNQNDLQNKKLYCQKCFEQEIGRKEKKVQQKLIPAQKKDEKKQRAEQLKKQFSDFEVQLPSINEAFNKKQRKHCTACLKQLLSYEEKEAIMVNNFIICSLCARMSQMTQERIEFENYYKPPKSKKQQRQPTSQRRQQTHNSKPVKEKIDEQNINVEQKIRKTDDTIKMEIKQKPKELQKQKIKSEAHEIKEGPQKDDTLKLVVSQKNSQKVQLNLSWLKDEEFITCKTCGLEIQATCAIWEEVGNQSQCRNCYCETQKLFLQKSQSLRNEDYKSSTSDTPSSMKRKYVEKQPEGSIQSQKKTQKVNSNEEKKASRSKQIFEELYKNQMNHNHQNQMRDFILSQKYRDEYRVCPICKKMKKISGKYKIGGIQVCMECQVEQTTRLHRTRYTTGYYAHQPGYYGYYP